MLVNVSSKSEVRGLQHEFQQLQMLSTLRLVLFSSVLSFSGPSLITSHVSLIWVFVNSDTTSYDTIWKRKTKPAINRDELNYELHQVTPSNVISTDEVALIR